MIDSTAEQEFRPWGYYVVLTEQAACKIKKMVVYPGHRLSLQQHRHRGEHWYIVQGRGLVTLNERQLECVPGQSIDIPRRDPHRIENKGSGNLVFIEIQTGDYFGEDDIERLEDDYGRTS
jgi:mannose-6-phosphate isomerase-like protein (cupin superfamily)